MEKVVIDDYVLWIVIGVLVFDFDIRVVRVRFMERMEDKGSWVFWDDVDFVVFFCIFWV